MERGCYQVDILHYLNPHLIWVEVVKNSESTVAKEDEYFFEQIGVYGLLPLNTTIDFETSNLKSQRCDSWVPAATTLMKKLFSEAKEIWFSPIYIDRKSSIFDSNIHKYGEIIIKRPSGKLKKVSKALANSGFAVKDDCLFHQELSLGNLKTKLSIIETQQVVKEIKKCCKKKDNPKNYWEQSVRNQTTVFHAEQDFELALTAKNLDKHNAITQNYSKDKVALILHKKFKDFELCKDIDEESLGRALKSKKASEDNYKVSPVNSNENKIPTTHNLNVSQNLHEKEAKLSNSASRQSTLQTLIATKQFLESKAKLKHKMQEEAIQVNTLNLNSEKTQIEKATEQELEEIIKMKYDCKNNYALVNLKTASSDDLEFGSEFSGINRVKTHLSSKRTPKYDVNKEKLVAYGPPGFDKAKLSLCVISKEKVGALELVPEVQNYTEMNENIDNTFADVDSEVNIVIRDTHIPKESNEEFCKIIKDTNEKNRTNKEKSQGMQSSDSSHSDQQIKPMQRSSVLQRKLNLHKKIRCKNLDSSITSESDTTWNSSSSSVGKFDSSKKCKNFDSDDENIDDIIQKLYLDNILQETDAASKLDHNTTEIADNNDFKNYANPFKNIDPNISVFVDKLVGPVLMVHSKMNKRIQPCSSIQDICFSTHINITLRNLNIQQPMTLQKISWFTILRGYSLFMVGPLSSGKTMGYIPAVCRLISDNNTDIVDSVGPTCIIVCATAQSVAEVEKLCKMFLGIHEKVYSCYAGMDDLDVTTSLLNGCDLLLCTPCALVRLLQNTNFSVDLRRLSTFVLDDCERLEEIYKNEMKFFTLKIKEMLKSRANKELKVQYVLASRVWCDFMLPLAKKVPDTVICISAFQECVLYSQANTTVDLVKTENKNTIVLNFLKDIDTRKKTVIACRTDEEVVNLEKFLIKYGYIVFACNSTMNVQDLYNMNIAWGEYQEPVSGPILVCCDTNLAYLNITDAHHLIHYSLPNLFSAFCKRFSTLNENYASIFKIENEKVKIKILLDQSNLEQLPKILNFIKRCTNEFPPILDEISNKVLAEKDIEKAKNFVPLCDNLLNFGECPDFWNCKKRHSVLKEYDEPTQLIPVDGHVTFKLLHCHTAILYSARLLSNIIDGEIKKYPQVYSTLSLKMGRYFSKESNRRLQGIPKLGDICAVAIEQNRFARCQVIKIISFYPKGNPNHVLIKLIDEEKLDTSRDIHLYYLPEELKNIPSYVVQIRLANIQPKDKDVTFSTLARDHVMRILDKNDDIYMRGRITLTVGNCVFIDTLEACQDLSTLGETVVQHNVKSELLEKHAIPNPLHHEKLLKICNNADINIKPIKPVDVVEHVIKQEEKQSTWAHLEDDDLSCVFFASAKNPGNFFIRLVKFENCVNLLLKEIQKYITESNPEPVAEVKKGHLVLAKYPDDSTYERARIDHIVRENKVKCFFVDQGDWREVSTQNVFDIPNEFLARLPFQAIECRLIGVKPLGEYWTDFSTNWLYNKCFDDDGNLKFMYVKYFTKEIPRYTEGHKYSVAMIDTNTDVDIVINKLMIETNMARKDEEEFLHLNNLNYVKESTQEISEDDNENHNNNSMKIKNSVAVYESPLDKVFLKQPIRSVPLVTSDDEISDDSEKWQVNITDELMMSLFKPTSENAIQNLNKSILPTEGNNIIKENNIVNSESSSSSQASDSVTPSPPKSVKEIDSDDFSSSELTDNPAEIDKPQLNLFTEKDPLRKPRLVWRQNKTSVFIKIQLIGVVAYDLLIKERHLKFATTLNDTDYGFEFELYGVIDTEKSAHSNKEQYILITLSKVLKKNWLSLTKGSTLKKWIIYDVDAIDTSSDEESVVDDSIAKAIKNMIDNESDTDDDDFCDDVSFRY